MSDGAHDHAAYAAAIADLAARVTKLETATPPVPPTPPTRTPSSPILVPAGASDVVIENLSFNAPFGSGYAIYANGTPSKPIRRLTIRNCGALGGNVALQLENVIDLVVEKNDIDDVEYAAVLLWGITGQSRIEGNTVTGFGPKAPGPDADAYGIAVRDDTYQTADLVIRDNMIDGVRGGWKGLNQQGLNAHSGTRLLWEGNDVVRVRRPYFMASEKRITDSVIRGNHAFAPVGNTVDPTAFFLNHTDRCSVIGNSLSAQFPVGTNAPEWVNFVRDYGARAGQPASEASTALVRSGNTRA